MAEITQQDQANLTKLRLFAGPEMAAFAEKMMAMKGQNPALDRAGDAFEAHASNWKNIGQLKALNEQFKNNPQLAGKMEHLLKTNPEAFERNVGKMFETPHQTLAIVEKELLASSATPVPPAPMEVPAETPPATQVVRDLHKPVTEPKTQTQKNEIIVDKVLAEGLSPAEKLAEMATVPGFDGLMERIEKNPHLRDMFSGITGGDPEKSSEMVDTLYQQVKANPEFFNEVNKTIDNTPPGTMSTIASMIANDSKSGFAAFGIYNNLQNSQMGSFLQTGMGAGLLSSILPMIANMMQFLTGSLNKVKGFVGDHLKDSTDLMAQENRPGMTTRALDAVKARPGTNISMVDAHTGDVAKTTAGALKDQEATTPPDQKRPTVQQGIGPRDPAFNAI